MSQFQTNIKGVPVSTNFAGAFTVDTAPTGLPAGTTAYFSDALKAAETTGNGTGNLAFYDGSNWIRVDTGAAIGK